MVTTVFLVKKILKNKNNDNTTNIKKQVKNGATISIGLDPMVAVMNGIKSLDGYYPMYPLSYKYKFRI